MEGSGGKHFLSCRKLLKTEGFEGGTECRQVLVLKFEGGVLSGAPNKISRICSDMIEIFLYYFRFGGARFFVSFFALLVVYFNWKIWYHLFQLVLFNTPLPASLKLLAQKIIFTFIGIGVICIPMGFALEKVVLRAQVPKIVFFSQAFLQIDKMVFGTYVPFWFQSSSNNIKFLFDALSLPIIIVYGSLAFLLGILLFLLFVFKPRYFYKAIMSFFIMFLIGLPLWFFFPAVSPHDAYIDNVLYVPAPQYLQATLSEYHPNPHLQLYLTSVSALSGEGEEQFFAITTMPSMHIAWASLILFFGIILWRPLAFVLVPYFLLNAIATVYLLQHYAVDIPAGIIVGIISIWVAFIIAKRKTPKMYLD